jgi:RNA polymerase sigma-70 factor (ECF subfamily)
MVNVFCNAGRGGCGMNETEMRDLMLQSLAGDSIAHRRLLSQLAVRLHAFVGRRLFSDPDAVDDIVQEILMAVHQRRESYDPARPFSVWVYAIARFKMADFLRQRGRRGKRVPLDDAEFVMADADDQVGVHRRDLDRLLAQLPAKQSRAIRLVKIEGRPIRDVAESESMSETDVRVSIHRGMKKLAKLVMTDETP